jgi:hypothetical protein
MKKLVFGIFIAFSFAFKAQEIYRVFGDSLQGFDETQVKAEAISKNVFGEEYKYFLEMKKREFIINKYNLWHRVLPQKQQNSYQWYPAGKTMSCCPGLSCDNPDFELSPAGQVTSFNGVQGWTLSAGYNSFTYGFL